MGEGPEVMDPPSASVDDVTDDPLDVLVPVLDWHPVHVVPLPFYDGVEPSSVEPKPFGLPNHLGLGEQHGGSRGEFVRVLELRPVDCPHVYPRLDRCRSLAPVHLPPHGGLGRGHVGPFRVHHHLLRVRPQIGGYGVEIDERNVLGTAS